MHELLGDTAARERNGIRVMRKLLADRPPDYVAPESGLEARVDRLARDVGVLLRRQVDTGGEEWIGRVDFIVEGTNQSSRSCPVDITTRYWIATPTRAALAA